MPPQATDLHGASLEALCADLAGNNHTIVASNRSLVGFSDRTDRSGNSNAIKTGIQLTAGDLAPLRGMLPLTWISAAASGADRVAVSEAENGIITRGLPPGW
jgi:hypothetical protein